MHFFLSNSNFITRIIWARSGKTFAKLSGKQNRKNTGQDRIQGHLGATFTFTYFHIFGASVNLNTIRRPGFFSAFVNVCSFVAYGSAVKITLLMTLCNGYL